MFQRLGRDSAQREMLGSLWLRCTAGEAPMRFVSRYLKHPWADSFQFDFCVWTKIKLTLWRWPRLMGCFMQWVATMDLPAWILLRCLITILFIEISLFVMEQFHKMFQGFNFSWYHNDFSQNVSEIRLFHKIKMLQRHNFSQYQNVSEIRCAI